MIKSISKLLYVFIIIAILCPWEIIIGIRLISPATALFIGLVYAICFGCCNPKFNKIGSRYLLQASVVGLGFGMNIVESLKSGSEGISFTIISVCAVMALGVLIGHLLNVNRKTAYLISSGTAICGGSAIAAIGPIIKAKESEMAISLGVIFILNAIALFIFPPIGRYFDLSQQQFGSWIAIAIHDTSSVVGAGDIYGAEALQLATLIKLTRALWIIPLAFVTMLLFRDKQSKINIPWFILFFIIAMIINTYTNLPTWLSETITLLSKKGLVLTLFFIGAGLSINNIKSVGVKPLILAIALWAGISMSSFFVIVSTID